MKAAIKKPKRVLSLFLCLMLCTALININVREGKAMDIEKPVLLFQIDEGQLGAELLTYYQTQAELKQALDNIMLGLEMFTEKYTPAVLIYPTYNYDVNGYGGDPTQPLNRISPNLLYTFDYFKEKGICVYLEMHSSGIRTQYQKKTPAPLYYGDDTIRQSLPMDLDAMIALKQAYGDTFKGIRFHELIGSNDIGLRDRENGTEETSHAWVVQEDVLKAIIKEAASCGLELVWSDHSWNLLYRQDGKPKRDYAYWFDWVDYAVDTMGPQNITINWANNGWPVHQYIEGTCLIKNYRDTKYGESVQSWFWQEMDCATIQHRNSAGNAEIKWYLYPEIDMPIELFAAFCLRALESGATMLQFEPTFYLFNFHSSRFIPAMDYPGQYETAADYTPRLATKRLAQYLLSDSNGSATDTNLTKWFETDYAIFNNNKEANPPKRYYQTTLCLVNKANPNEPVYYDRYTSDLSAWTEQNENRFVQNIYDNMLDASRMNLTFSGIDESIIIKNIEDKLQADFYTNLSGKIKSESEIFSHIAASDFIACLPINIFEEYVSSLEGSSDDLIMLYKQGDSIISEIYKTKTNGHVAYHNFMFERLEGVQNEAELIKLMGSTAISSQGFVAAVPIRTHNAVNLNAIRKKDAGIMLLHQTENNSINLSGAMDEAPVNQSININGRLIDATSADINMDYKDEICLLIEKEGRYAIQFLNYDGAAWHLLEESIVLSDMPDTIYSLRWATATMATEQ